MIKMLPKAIHAITITAVSAMALSFPSSSLPETPAALVMLDRDGVINQDVGSPGVLQPNQFELTPGAATAIGDLKRSGYSVVVITNQSCVGKGLLSMLELEEIHNKMTRLLMDQDDDSVIDRIYFCTSLSEDDPRKKPNPGMIIEACDDMGVDPVESIFVGDTLTDMQAAQSGGVRRRILVQTGYGFGLMGNESACVPPRIILEEKAPSDASSSSSSSSWSSQRLNSVKPFVYAANLADAVVSIVGKQI